jgi:hypothetical protein
LCKQFFPGIVEYAGTQEPACTFDHYAAALDLPDRLCRQFHKAQWVVNELLVRLHRTTLLITSHSFNNL